MKKLIGVSFLILFLLVPTAVLAQDSNVVAEINGDKITEAQLTQEMNMNQIVSQLSGIDQQLAQLVMESEEGKALLDKYREIKLQALVENTLITQEAQDADIALTDEEKNGFYNQHKNMLLQRNEITEEEFQDTLEKRGYSSETEYKNEIINNPVLKTNKFLEQKVFADIDVSESEIKTFYEENKENFANNGQEVTFEQAKPQIQQMVMRAKQQEQYKEFVENLKDNADIKIYN
ncbi:MAG: SurA N-terminal domain-containing protein [Bacillota bacterium]